MENDKSSDMKVYFAKSGKLARLNIQSGLALYPARENWNDFGFETSFIFELIGSEKNLSGQFRLAFMPDSSENRHNSREYTEKVLAQHGNVVGPLHWFPIFFSLQLDLRAYEVLVNEKGADGAMEILTAINDIAALKMQPKTPSWVQAAEETDVFNRSLIRSSETFYAYCEAHYALSGLPVRAYMGTPNGLNLVFKLSEFACDHSFQFAFDQKSIVPKRIAVIIGKNGVGKSQTLKHIVDALVNKNENLTDASGGRPRVSQLIAVCTPGDTESTFPLPPIPSRYIKYKRFVANLHVDNGVASESLPNTILRLARSIEHLGENARWDIFKQAIGKIIDFNSLCIYPRIQVLDSSGKDTQSETIRHVYFTELRSGSELRKIETMERLDRNGTVMRAIDGKCINLSSGQLAFIRLAAQLCLHIERGTLLLIDEPETHLHPNLVTGMVAMINKILELSQSVAVVATHSAYFVREVPSRQVHIIKAAEEGIVEVMSPRIKTFGADVGAISNYVFGDDLVNKLIEDVEILTKGDTLRVANFIGAYKEDLSTEAVIYLKSKYKAPRV